MTAHLAPLAALAASLPPGAVLAHVVTQRWISYDPSGEDTFSAGQGFWHRRAWAKIGGEPWRSVFTADLTGTAGAGLASLTIEAPALYYGYTRVTRRVVTRSVTWEQSYGLRGRHEVMGVVG